MRFDKSEPIKNAGAKTPVRKAVLPDGTIHEIKLSPIPFRMDCVHPNGHTVSVSLASGATIRSFDDNPYGVMIRREKIAKGFLPVKHCPYAKGYVPLPIGEDGKPSIAPCVGDWPDDFSRRGEFKTRFACDHLRDIAKARKARKAKKSARFNKKFETGADKMLELLGEQNKMLIKAAEAREGKSGTTTKKMPKG